VPGRGGLDRDCRISRYRRYIGTGLTGGICFRSTGSGGRARGSCFTGNRFLGSFFACGGTAGAGKATREKEEQEGGEPGFSKGGYGVHEGI
jgi:hypothetical protein